jgi:DtxR family manganese transport transcriptional regulator
MGSISVKSKKAANSSQGGRPRGRRRTERDPAAARQAARHQRIRHDHSSEIAEDYVELIAQLIAQRREARTVELAQRLGVSHVTVTKTIARLQREGLVRSEPYRSIFLTAAGEQLARETESRHALIVQFLRRLGVGEADAETDAEGIEHHVSEATLRAMRRFISAGPSTDTAGAE